MRTTAATLATMFFAFTTGPSSAADPWDQIPKVEFPRGSLAESRWFIAHIDELPPVKAAGAAWVAAAGAIDRRSFELAQAIEQPPFLLELSNSNDRDGILDVSEAAPSMSSVQDMLFRALYGYLERRAKRELIAFVVARVDHALCDDSPAAPFLTATCAVVKAPERQFDLEPLRLALRKDLFELPFAAARRVSLPPALGCGVRILDRVRLRVTNIESLGTIVAILHEGLLLDPCSSAFGGASGTLPAKVEPALRALRLLAALHAEKTRGAAELAAAAHKTVLELMRLPAVTAVGEVAIRTRIETIVDYLRGSGVLDRPKWEAVVARARGVLAQQVAKRAEAEGVALAIVRQEAEKFLMGLPFERLTRPVLAADWPAKPAVAASPALANLDRDDLQAAISLVRGAAQLTRELLEAAHLDRDKLALIGSGLDFAEQCLAGRFWTALDNAVASPALANVEPFKTLGPWVGLVAGIADAQTAADVERVLERYGEADGAWDTRRDGIVFAVSGQFGIGASSEDLIGAPGAPTGAFGLSVPVGLDVSVPLGNGWALGFMAQVFDLGAIGTARFDSDVAEIEPRFGLVQVLAPGLRAFLGLGRTPFVLTGHLDIVPSLRTRTSEEGDRGTTVFRAGLGLAIDLPILIL